MKQLLLTLVVVVGLVDSAAAQGLKLDGNFWNSLNEDSRRGYAAGFLQGVHFGEDLILVGFASVGSEAATLFRSQGFYAAYLKGHFADINVKQVTDGLNSFYGDFRNRNIELPKAVWVIAHEIAGIPRAEVEATIEGLRRGAMKEPKHQ